MAFSFCLFSIFFICLEGAVCNHPPIAPENLPYICRMLSIPKMCGALLYLFFSEVHAQSLQDEKTISSPVSAKNISAFELYNAKGKKISYAQFLKSLKAKIKSHSETSTVLLFGELHDNPIVHWLQIQMSSDLYRSNNNMVLGAEMFETNQQMALDEYLNPSDSNQAAEKIMSPMGAMTGDDPAYTALKKSIKLWPNYKTDYAPLLNFAKENGLPFIATNIPRKYANLVYRGDFQSLDTLSLDQKKLFPNLPISYDSTLRCYKEIFMATGGHGGQNLPKSQAIKDATMAWKIWSNLPQPTDGIPKVSSESSSKPPNPLSQKNKATTTFLGDGTPEPSTQKKSHTVGGGIFIHYNGTYHSDRYESISWYLRKEEEARNAVIVCKEIPKPIHIITIASRLQDAVNLLEKENINIADFVIVIPTNMTRTY